MTEAVVGASPDAIVDRRLESARRDVPRREERLGLAEGARLRHGRASSTPPASRTFIAWETGRVGEGRQAMVLGGHGDQMVPVVIATTVGGVPLTKLVAARPDRGDGRAHPQGRRRGRQPARHVGVVRARCRGRADGRRDRASTRSACSRARRTSRASTASTASTWACRSSSARPGSSEIVELDLTDEERGWLDESTAAVRDVVGVLTT